MSSDLGSTPVPVPLQCVHVCVRVCLRVCLRVCVLIFSRATQWGGRPV